MHAPAAREHGFAASFNDPRRYRLGGVGGDAYGRRGKLRWFEFGGRRFRRLPVTAVEQSAGRLDDPYMTGTIGTGVLGDMRVVFDYPRARVTFELSAASETSASGQ